MCLQYKPTVVACFCIHLACKWSRWEVKAKKDFDLVPEDFGNLMLPFQIPQSTEGKHWFQYVDKSVTMELLQKLTEEFLHIFDRCPSRLKSKMKSISASAQASRPVNIQIYFKIIFPFPFLQNNNFKGRPEKFVVVINIGW